MVPCPFSLLCEIDEGCSLLHEYFLAIYDVDARLQVVDSLTCEVVQLLMLRSDCCDVVDACSRADQLYLIDVTVSAIDGDAEGLLAEG